jgi:hypothetical protein
MLTTMISETKRSKNIQKLDKKQQMQPLKGKVKRMFATFFSAFLAFLAVVTAYYTFAFKISINPSGSLDPSDPFATPFILQNDSLLWINLIEYNFSIRKIDTANYVVIKGIDIFPPINTPPIPYLSAREKTTIILPFRNAIIIPAPITYADIEIVVSYYPAFISFHKKEKRMHFVAIKSINGTLHWVDKAMSENLTH